MSKKKQENVQIIKGDIFETKCQTIVNPINCGGTMSKGIGGVLKQRYAKYFPHYSYICKNKLIDIGILWLYVVDDWWILSFPTKVNGKTNAKLSDIEKGLDKFISKYKEKGITSIAFPLLDDKLDREEVLPLMVQKLSQCDIPIEIYVPETELEKKLKHKGEQLELWI